MSEKQMPKNTAQKHPNSELPVAELHAYCKELRAVNKKLKEREQQLHNYIRAKTDQLLSVIGTLPLSPEELDDENLISVDPIGIVGDSFTQIIEHLHETNEDLSFAADELQAVFDSAGAGILVATPDKQLTAFNRTSRELFFPSVKEPLNHSCQEIVCISDLSRTDCIIEKILATGERETNPDFTVNGRYFQVVGTPIKNKSDIVSRIIIVYSDITERKENELALQKAEKQLDTILNSTQAGIILIDPQTHKIVYANQAVVEMTGFRRSYMQGKICHNIICSSHEGHCPITDHLQEIDKSECTLKTIKGRDIPILKTVTKVEIDSKEHLIESFIDISERKLAEEKLRESEERYRALYSNMQEGVAQYRMIYDEAGNAIDYEVIDINQAYENIAGLKRRHVIGKMASSIYPRQNGKVACLDIFTKVVENNISTSFEFEFNKLGLTVNISAAKLAADHFAIIFEDITQRKIDEKRIEKLAFFDNLTDLPNRTLMQDRLLQMTSRAKRSQGKVGVFFLDLDNFKRVNDTFGHDVGDQLLIVVAKRLRTVLRDCDTICRLGGDEFVILIEDMLTRNDAAMIACKILEILAQPIVLRSKEVYASTSIGISLFPEDGANPDTLLKNADAAMYQAKESGRNTYCFYSSEMNSKALEQMMLANDLRKALDRNEFYLEYQPQIDLKEGRINGTEALLRWQHADFGVILPDQFIPMAEETGLILLIGQWVIEKACQQTREIQQRCNIKLRVAVNLSAKQFQDPDLLSFIKTTLDNTGLGPEDLELEITESILMENIEEAQHILHKLRTMGVTLAIDDFGTGYSSLSYLRNFPINRLKIDKSFIQRIYTHPDDAAITEAIIVMGHIIGIKIVAEGVEQKDEMTFLQANNCDEAQGFYFSKPIDHETLAKQISHQPEFCFFNSGI